MICLDCDARKNYYQKQSEEIEHKRIKAFEELKEEMHREIRLKVDYYELPSEPIKPNRRKYFFKHDGKITGVSVILIAIFVNLFLALASPVFGVICVILLLIGLPLSLYFANNDYLSAISWYEQVHKSWEYQRDNIDDYKDNMKKSIIEKYEKYADNIARYGKREHDITQRISHQSSNQNVPKCPTCGSTNIEKISTTSKVVGATMFGLLSKTARSQFKCKNCGYKW